MKGYQINIQIATTKEKQINLFISLAQSNQDLFQLISTIRIDV